MPKKALTLFLFLAFFYTPTCILAGDIIEQAASSPDKDKVVNLEDNKT